LAFADLMLTALSVFAAVDHSAWPGSYVGMISTHTLTQTTWPVVVCTCGQVCLLCVCAQYVCVCVCFCGSYCAYIVDKAGSLSGDKQ